jgi:hypothetical protein
MARRKTTPQDQVDQKTQEQQETFEIVQETVGLEVTEAEEISKAPEPAVEPVTDQVTDKIVEPMTKPVSKPVIERMVEPAVEPVPEKVVINVVNKPEVVLETEIPEERIDMILPEYEYPIILDFSKKYGIKMANAVTNKFFYLLPQNDSITSQFLSIIDTTVYQYANPKFLEDFEISKILLNEKYSNSFIIAGYTTTSIKLMCTVNSFSLKHSDIIGKIYFKRKVNS